MAFYFNQSLSTAASAYTQFTTMISAMVASGTWSYVTSSATSGIVSLDDEFAETLPFYIQYVWSSANVFSISFGASGWSTPMSGINNNGTATPYAFTLNTSATTGIQNYDITVNAYDSGFTFYASQIQASSNYTGTILLNIERGRSLDGEKLSDIVAFGYLSRKWVSAFPKLTNNYTASISSELSTTFTVLDAICSTTTITSHDTGRPAFLRFGNTDATSGELPSKPYFNPETVSLLSAGPFAYAASAKKLYGNPYLLTCSSASSASTVTSTSQFPFLMEPSTDVDFTVGGVKRTFWVPPYCISENASSHYMYYLLAKE